MWRDRLTRRTLFWVIVATQVAVLLGFAGWREVGLRTGTEVVLATVPVDPRDLFRGDYVALRYEISTIDGCFAAPRSDVYVLLRQDGGVWRYAGNRLDLDSARSTGQSFIRGQVRTRQSNSRCEVGYGIESYFVPEGTGRSIEQLRGQLKVRVVLDEAGDAAIRGLDLR